MSIHQGYYAIIPANVRYSKEVSDGAKLLYGEITALCDKSGYCWASNAYFAALYSASNRTVSRWISELSRAGFIVTLADNAAANSRKIWIKDGAPHDKNVHTPTTKMSIPPRQKWRDPMDKNVQRNTTVNTTVDKPTTVGNGANAPTPQPPASGEKSLTVKAKTATRKETARAAAPPVPEPLASSLEFMAGWTVLLDCPKWKKKTTAALAASLKQLEKYPPEFAAGLVQNAIAGNYQGVVFGDTPDAYAKWQKARNPQAYQEPARPGPNYKNVPTYG